MFKRLGAGAVIFAAACEMASADVNICWQLAEAVWVPPTPLDAGQCVEANAPICAAGLVHCCLPECNLFPECRVAETLLEGNWDTIECELFDPEVALERAFKGVFTPITDSLAPIRSALVLHIESLTLAASPIPDRIKAVIRELTNDGSLPRLDGFRPGDIERARILSTATATSDIYLPNLDFTRAAITLDELIILQSNRFDALSANQDLTVMDIRCGRAPAAYLRALTILVHELVHVRQWDELGRDTFLASYLIEVMARGYGNDSYETEANLFDTAFAAILAMQLHPDSFECAGAEGRTRFLPAVISLILAD